MWFWIRTAHIRQPFIGTIGGENVGDDTLPADRWRWTPGKAQYERLEGTLEQSRAKYKFVFAHQAAGGGGRDADYSRGGEKATVDYVRAFLPGAGPKGDIEYSYSITKDDSPSDRSKTEEGTTH